METYNCKYNGVKFNDFEIHQGTLHDLREMGYKGSGMLSEVLPFVDKCFRYGCLVVDQDDCPTELTCFAGYGYDFECDLKDYPNEEEMWSDWINKAVDTILQKCGDQWDNDYTVMVYSVSCGPYSRTAEPSNYYDLCERYLGYL